ncbi:MULTISPECIES: DUF1475 family protein [unclassified Nitrospina]|uniref:DUF1475 family protein n=1 Tax=unclassified Nitrospina TaxID=2638683 RepID=UPI003F9BECDC
MRIEIKFSILLAGFLLVLLLGAIIWSSVESNVFVGFQQLLKYRWGLTTLLDIYIGLTFIGVWIGVIENSVAKGIVWTISLYLLGNLATLFYFIYRSTKSSSFTDIFIPKAQR